MIITAALYHSFDPKNEEFWDTVETGKKYGITIAGTGQFDWGGESIFTIQGTIAKLEKFAKEFCSADNLTDLEPSVA